jgi:hypothetical protein
VRQSEGPRRWWWLGALRVVASLVVGGAGTLEVTPGTGSAAPFTQIAFEVTVSSPYASTTFAEWVVRGAGPGGMNSQNAGACVLSSSLLGPRARIVVP